MESNMHIQNNTISTGNQYKNNIETFSNFFVLNVEKHVCALELKHISIQTSHISNVP